ncbi:hypothetical protein [Streptomyces albidoflavus]|uniref:hypothetical protein n=1 Tax=Streptomyces albidoflavus TaxID=1886 RepID=UPI00332C9862
MTIPDAVATAFTEAFDGYTADDVAARFTCIEIEALAELLKALGRPDLADTWIEAHALDDDKGDAHYRQTA